MPKQGKGKTAAKPPQPKAKAARVATDAASYLKELNALKERDAPDDFAMLEHARYAEVQDRLPTGALALDRMLGGGWPEGRIIEVAAWEGVGKSTLLDQTAAHCQRLGGVVALIDSEQARDLAYTRKLGVKLDDCILGDVDDIEEGFDQLDKIVTVQEAKRIELAKVGKRPPPLLCLWDSLGGTPAREELKGAADDAHVSPAARKIALNFRRLTVALSRNRITLIFANHFYQQIGGFAELKSYGGKGVRYFTSVRLWLTRTGELKAGSDVVGHMIKATLRKTRVGPPRPYETIGLVHTAGLDNSFTLFEWGMHAESSPGEPWIWTHGTHRYLRPPGREPIHFQRGFAGLAEILSSEPEIYAQMAGAYLQSPILVQVAK